MRHLRNTAVLTLNGPTYFFNSKRKQWYLKYNTFYTFYKFLCQNWPIYIEKYLKQFNVIN